MHLTLSRIPFYPKNFARMDSDSYFNWLRSYLIGHLHAFYNLPKFFKEPHMDPF
jgi:hypothetical protein